MVVLALNNAPRCLPHPVGQGVFPLATVESPAIQIVSGVLGSPGPEDSPPCVDATSELVSPIASLGPISSLAVGSRLLPLDGAVWPP